MMQATCTRPAGSGSGAIPRCFPSECPAGLIGQAGSWLRAGRDGDTVVIEPVRPLPRRCTVRPAAIFKHDRGFFEACMVMGQVVMPAGATEPARYRPFTYDPQRRPVSLWLPVEAMPHDQLAQSPERWRNGQAVAKQLLREAGVAWDGFTPGELDRLISFVPHPDPVEACVLHALVGWVNGGEAGADAPCVVEIGSFRGVSASVLAMGLRAAESDGFLISVDPHDQQRNNAEHVQLALRQIGEERRLVQIPATADRARRVLSDEAASLVFIDRDHARDAVVADFESYRSVLRPGGVMAFHDYGFGVHTGQPDPHPGVRAAVDEVVFGSGEFAPVLLAHTLMAFVKTA